MPRLSNDAVPTIFPGCPSYLNINTKTRKPPLNRDISDSQIGNKNKRRKMSVASSVTEAVDNAQTNNNIETFCDTRISVHPFEKLWENNCSSVKLPEHWSFHKITDESDLRKKRICFSKMFISKQSTLSIIERQVVIDSNFEIKIGVLGTQIYLPEISENIVEPELVENLQNVLLQVDNLKICPGGPSFSKFHPSTTYSESSIPNHALEIWRHVKCPLVQNSLQRCKMCLSLKNTMRIHQNRKRKITSRLKVRTKCLLSDKSQLESLRNIKNKQKKITFRAMKRLEMLRKELADMQNKMKNIKEEKLETYLQDSNLPQQQKVLIKECINISKVPNKKGRRYSYDWLLYCLLLSIRSTSTYHFLRDNDILPLPSPTTMRRYLARVNMKCGLDEQFFKALRLKLSRKTNLLKHGVLLFDEMQVRKSIKVNTKTMELVGIEDFGDDVDDEKTTYEIADHALVFMFCPAADSYTQPVALYASKNATKGIILASLIVKVIQELEKAGAFVDGIICDGASTNRRMWKEFGISGSLANPNNKCIHPVDEKRMLFFFSDTPHLFKCIRNRVLQKGYVKVNKVFFYVIPPKIDYLLVSHRESRMEALCCFI